MLELNIIEFAYTLGLLRAGSLSLAQKTILKATYGEPLDQAEMEFYHRATGRETYNAREHDELTLIAGRRSGKTSIIGALVALYEAFRTHGLPPGRRACVLVVAPVVHQAAIAFDFIKDYISESPILRRRVLRIRNNEIGSKWCRNGMSPVLIRSRKSGIIFRKFPAAATGETL
jgi:hypothetical protein